MYSMDLAYYGLLRWGKLPIEVADFLDIVMVITNLYSLLVRIYDDDIYFKKSSFTLYLLLYLGKSE